MRYPQLVPHEWCKTPIRLWIEGEGLDVYGGPKKAIEWSGFCNFQDGAAKQYTSEKKLVVSSARALIPGDICPELAVISGGRAEVFGEKRVIVSGRKNRNPDGTVNYTTIDLR